jgi:diguanylate cyclase
MSQHADLESSIAHAGIAFEKMKALRYPPTPHNYEVWYNYACASNQSLSECINELIASRGTVSANDLDEIYERFFSSAPMNERIDSVGSQMMGEIDSIITMIDGTLASNSQHSESIADVSGTIEDTTDLRALRGLIGRLLQTTRDIERVNQKFEVHLKESKDEINQLQQHLEAVRSEILTDPLTTLSNRKHFDQAIIKVIADANAAKPRCRCC